VQKRPIGNNTIFYVDCFLPKGSKTEGVFFRLDPDGREGTVAVGAYGSKAEESIHPVTLKRWTELLLTNPRIDPTLKARIIG
jgi:hypothetical protein